MRNLGLGRILGLIAAVLMVASFAPGSGAALAATETVLYSFCAQGGTSCTDSKYPEGGLVMDAAGRLYGATRAGGAHAVAGSLIGGGTVFDLP